MSCACGSLKFVIKRSHRGTGEEGKPVSKGRIEKKEGVFCGRARTRGAAFCGAHFLRSALFNLRMSPVVFMQYRL